ncbi:PREDICTED: uncharacterized protein LOC109211991 [Nicotiana attenuata]|uniref:uncharacterized protein LOC109211991 n=1 Tax=Nicotiana attenuata TaxID=49451 RepID=UPI0009055CFD|nr:PREDICTED: uncharacterized protein LOC109211991 [Nicotiana attenuata]
MIWYHSLPPNSIDSFAILADSFIKAHAGTIKVESKKLDHFKVKQRDNEMLRVDDDQLGAPSGSVYPVKAVDIAKRDIDCELRSSRDSYQPYNGEHRGNGSGRNPIRSERRSDRGQSNQRLMGENGFDRPIVPKEASRLPEYNFNVDVAAIVSAIGRIKDTKWPRPLQSDPTQRDLNQMCKYHGTHGHKKEDCRQLREEVARLFNNGHLREFLSDQAKNHFRNRDSNKQAKQEEPQHVINMFIGGVDVPQGPMLKRTKVSITREK